MALLIPVLFALIVVVAVLRSVAGKNPAFVMKLARISGAAVLVALAMFLLLREVFVPAVLLAAVAWGLYSDGALFKRYRARQSERSADPLPRRGRTQMSRDEALQVLGLAAGATPDDIRAAHRRLILQTHPDKGGSDYLAAKINEAKDVLLGG